jgi:hypothetical protein
VQTPGQGPRRKRRPILPHQLKGIPIEEDSLSKPDYEAIDITYEYWNPNVDSMLLRRRNPPPRGTLERH